MIRSDIQYIISEIKKFRDERDWKQYHNPKDIAICLSVEASELLELFLWKDSADINLDKLQNELADVLYSAFLLSDTYGFDVKEIVLSKLTKNKIKYPIQKSKGRI